MNRRKPPAGPSDLLVLENVRSLLLPKGVWIKGALTQTSTGSPTSLWLEGACKFSLDGALLRVGHITKRPVTPAHKLLQWHISSEVLVDLAKWNDAKGTTFAALIELLNKAIKDLGGEAVSPYEEEEA